MKSFHKPEIQAKILAVPFFSDDYPPNAEFKKHNAPAEVTQKYESKLQMFKGLQPLIQGKARTMSVLPGKFIKFQPKSASLQRSQSGDRRQSATGEILIEEKS